MHWKDYSFDKILSVENIDSIKTVGEFALFALKHLPSYIVLYLKHLLNMISPISQEVYIRTLEFNKYLLALNYLIYFISTLNIYILVRTKKMKSNFWLLIFLIILPALMAVPGAVEGRYGISLFFVIVSTLILADFKQLINFAWKHKIIIVTSFILITLFLIKYYENLASLASPLLY